MFGRFYRGAGSGARADSGTANDRNSLQEATGRDMGGSGLGLAIVREIVERHGGTVRAESSTPHGLVIVIGLPALG